MTDIFSSPLPYLVGFAALLTVVISIVSSRRRREREIAQAAKDEREARLRGWTLETHGVGTGFGSYVYSGTREGIAWRFHTGRQTARVSDDDSRVPNPPSRWETASVRLNSGSIQIWPSRGENFNALRSVNAPQFVMQLILRPLANALGGSAEDVESLMAGEVVDAGLAERLFVRATDPDRARRFFENGAREELAAAEWLTTDELNPMVLVVLWRHGLTILCGGKIHDPERIDKVVRLGTALARAAG